MIKAVALTNAIVGIKAQKINAYRPDAIQSLNDGIFFIKSHPTKLKNNKIKNVLGLNFGRVIRIKII